MPAFDVLSEPVRRRILELLRTGEHSSGALTKNVQHAFGITQPAVSQHLKVLRESGFASVRPQGARRLYRIESAPLRAIDDWLEPFRVSTQQREAPPPEVARGTRERPNEDDRQSTLPL